MSRAARATLIVSSIFAIGTIWGVHFLQLREREVGHHVQKKAGGCSNFLVDSQTMYQGVIRDDARRTEKLRERQRDLEESLRKRKIYERVQVVARKDDVEG